MKATSWRERADRLPHVGPDFAIASENAALVVVDMQYMFADRDYGVGRLLETYPESGRYYFDNVDARVVPNNQRLIELFRRHDLPIIWLAAAGRHPGAWDCCRLISGRDPKMQSDSGLVTTGFFHRSKDSHIVEAVAPRDDEILILKQSYGAFNSTGIDSTLRNLGVDTVFVTGLVTNGCVEETATGAADRSYKTTIVEDACTTFDEDGHEATLIRFATLFGRVMTTEEVVRDLENDVEEESPGIAA